MSSALAVSTEINLSSATIKGVALEVADMAQVLGLPLNKGIINLSEQYVEIRRLVELYSNFESFPIPSPDQCWQ